MSEQTSWIKQTSATHVGLGGQEWWRTSAVYQVYPRSWADSNGDGVGDLPGITAKLPYLRDLGVDALWISPFYTSPMADAGYDVADYRDIDPLFGTLADADKLIARAHELDLRVIVDLVPNHSSDEHEWFKAALAAGPGSPERERYLFRDGKGENGELPPNDWQAIFGGNAWTRVSDADGNPEQWYLHLFDPKQPDFNWNNEAVRAEFLSILRFWLDRGVDGFRLDTVNFYFHSTGLENNPPLAPELRNATIAPDVNPYNHQDHLYDKSQPENLAFLERFRALLDEYPAAAAVGEVGDAQRGLQIVADYTAGSDRMHMCYSFDFLSSTRLTAERVREVVQEVTS